MRHAITTVSSLSRAREAKLGKKIRDLTQMYIFGSSRVHELSSCRVTSSFSSSRVVELFLGFVPFPVPSSRFPVKYGATLFRPKSHGSKKGVGLISCRDVEKAY